MVQFPVQDSSSNLNKNIFVPAAWVTCGNDKIQGAKQKESGKNAFFFPLQMSNFY